MANSETLRKFIWNFLRKIYQFDVAIGYSYSFNSLSHIKHVNKRIWEHKFLYNIYVLSIYILGSKKKLYIYIYRFFATFITITYR